MDTKEIQNIFNNRKSKEIGNYKRAAVMLLLYEENNKTYLILEKRALTLRSQPGDICLPGGKVEENETFMETALRETCEELGVKKEWVEIIAPMDYLITPFSVIMYPFIGKINNLSEEFNKEEVDSIIKIPLKFFLENKPKCYNGEIEVNRGKDFPFHLINGGERYKFSKGEFKSYFYMWNDLVVWGHTATIINKFIEIIQEKE